MDPDPDLSIINPHPTKLDGPSLLHELITSPCDSVALDHLHDDVNVRYTYKDLHKLGDAVASRLSQVRGYRDGQFIVPVLIEQSPALHIVLLGILKAGGTFCPLNIDAPPDRVSFIFRDVAAKVVIVSRELSSKIPEDVGAEIIIAEDALDFIQRTVPSRSPGADDLAYVMYTSGSTGTPKGVGLSHGAVTQALLAHERHVPPFSRFLQFAAPTFDVSVFEIFFPLTREATLVVANRGEMLNDLPEVMNRMEVDACELTPTVAGSLLRTRISVPSLKLLLTIGEMLTEPVIREFGGDRERPSILWAMYGPTEATIHCTLQPSMLADSTVRNIGIPLDTVSCFIIQPPDENHKGPLTVLPRGETGELAVGGYQLAINYLNRPEQTAAAFISSPYGRLYRTGDKARLLSDGTLECLGRLSDGQVKLRGQRMELGEVEQAVLRTSGCHGAMAAVHDSILVVFCTVDVLVSEDAILDQCQRWLPRFMIPGEVVLMEAFPHLPSGKINRRQLIEDFKTQKLDAIKDGMSSVDDVPQELMETIRCALHGSIDSRSALSAAGLDSLKAITLASELRAAGFPADAVMLLRVKTVRDLWSALQGVLNADTVRSPETSISFWSKRAEVLAACPALRRRENAVEDLIPCTPLQTAMLFETLRQEGVYWNEVYLEVASNTTTVARAFHQVVQANELLRTGFVSYGKGFVSVVFDQLEDDQIACVDEVESGIPSDVENAFLKTLKVQIKPHDNGNGSVVRVCVHHAVYDGWSMDMIIADLSTIISGATPRSRPQFRAITHFHDEGVSDEAASVSAAFWANHLAGWTKDPFPSLLEDGVGGSECHIFKDIISISPAAVEKLAYGLGCSVQTLFQASLALTWGGILGSTDIVLGTVTSGRSIPVDDVERIIGPCIASLPLRINFERITETIHLLNHIHSANRAMLQHSAMPLSEIKKLVDLQPGDHLFDVLFAYQQSTEGIRSDNGIIQEASHVDRLETKLLIEVEPKGYGYVVQATYHQDAMESSMALALIGQIKTLVEGLCQRPQTTISTWRQGMTAAPAIFNHPPTPSSGVMDLASMFEEIASKHPEHGALSFTTSGQTARLSHEILSYRELNEMSNRIAHFLLSEGTGTRRIVAIIMNKSTLLYASILAIIKAGCAYLPILPSTPIERVRDILSQAKVRHCVVDEASSKDFRGIRDVRFINIESSDLNDFQSHNLDMPVDPSRLAYVIYTSGTTGTPKGVAVTQLNIASNIRTLGKLYPKSPDRQSRLLQACSQAFDVSVFEIFYAWHAGMCLYTGTNDTILEDLEYAIRELEITHLSLTPTVASLIKPENVPSVEFLVTAGEPMTEPVLEQWGDLLWQGYGPSETTNICSVKKMQKGMPIGHLGLVFPNTSVFVLSPGGFDTLPHGWVGEFCFGGDQVAHGYLNMPKTTSERFVNHPTLGRIYRSGDFGRMLPDGSLAILGRIDDQIKLRGLRIETGEISSIVSSTNAATSAVALLGRRRHASSDQLIAFYVPSDDTPGDGVLDIDDTVTRTLFSTLQSRLPSYMVPSYLIPLARIPLTSSGKLHRRRLQEWFRDLPSRYLEAAAPSPLEVNDGGAWSSTEALVAEVINQTMDTPKSEINRWTPFANFGIDSVSAISLASRLSTRLGCRVPISSVIRNANVVQLAGFLDSEKLHSPPRSGFSFFSEDILQSIHRDFGSESKDIQSVLPCTPLQEAMLSGTERSYFNRTMLRLHINGDQMRGYWDEMARRHEILRTCFVTTSDVNRPIAQVVLQKWTIPWRHFNVTQLSFDSVVGEHLHMLPAALDSKVPPLSLGLIRYRGSLFLSFICHHAMYDGVAMENLWREVEALANGLLLPPAVPYGPFLEEALDLPGDAESFWKDRLHDFSPTSLFASSSGRRVDQTSHTKSLRVPLSVLQSRVKALGVSLLSLCQGSWSNTLGISYSSSDVCFGNVISGRSANVEGVDKLIAPCFNTIPVRADLSTKAHGDELVKHFHQLNADMLPYQFTPLRLIQKLLNQQGRGIFETLLILQTPLHGMDDSVWILEEDNGDMDVPLVCEVVPCPNLNTVAVSMHYDMNVVDPTSAATILDVFEYLLERIIDAPYATLPNREGLPDILQDGLQGVRVRRQRQEILDQEFHAGVDWSSIERSIRKVIAQLSRQPEGKITRQTTIYQLGLDSINAVQIAALLRRDGLNASASDVIECPSCAKLAERLLASMNSPVPEPTLEYDLRKFSQDVSAQIKPKIPSDWDMEILLPCTPVQCAMITSFVQTGGQEYFNVLTYEIDGGVSQNALISAWEELQQVHPMLRTAFVPVTHPHTTFAMLRYTPATVILPVTISRDVDDESNALEKSLRESLIADDYLLPWHLRVAQSQQKLSMSLFIHHALYDAHSLQGLLSSLSSILRGRPHQNLSAIEPALSEMMCKSVDEDSEAREFWTTKAQTAVINSFPVMTPLRQSPERLQSETGALSISFSELQDAAQAAGVTVQAAIQAAWTRILSSYIGERSVVFGVTLSGRTSDATNDAPLPCLVTLPVVSSSVSANAELLQYMMDYNTQMHKAHFAPLRQVQKWLGHAATPVFDTLVSYNRSSQTPDANWPLRLVGDQPAVEYPVSLSIDVHNEKVQVSVSFKPSHVPREQAKIIHQQFDAVLSHLVFDPTGTEQELHKQVPELFSQLPPRTPVMHCSVEYLHQFVEEKAITHPDSTALEFVDSLHTAACISRRRWTFRELDEMGNRVAQLVTMKAPVNSIVAIHFGKCPEAYFSILGILKAGCSFVALDITAPASRKEFIMSDSEAPCILYGSGTIDFTLNPNISQTLISEDTLKGVPATSPILDDEFTPTSTCYCLYTSGTTGTPKGCEITHENAVQAMMAFQELFSGHWDLQSRWLQFAALHFDVSVLEQYWTWSVGMTVVAAPKDLILDDLTGTINKLDITHIDLTPSLARLTHPKDVPSLCKGVFITGGESLNQEVLDAWGDQAVIYNAYGPTEATIGVTMYQRVPVNGRPSNIGRQFPNVGSYVFQPGTEIPVLRGGVGELCVSGKLVGKGYLRRKDLTEERFPNLEIFKERVYRTGDLVRVLHDGCFDFLGRADDQVKLRGQRLEIGEINHIIRSVPEISDAATIVTSHGSSQRSVLVSFMVSTTGGDRARELEIIKSVEGLDLKAKEACRSRLPGYMVPSYCFELPYIPLSVNNKAEVKELKRLFTRLSHEELTDLVNAQTQSMAGLSDEEVQIITRVMSSFSGLSEKEISPQTSIFDVGVDSITALRLSSMLREEGLPQATPAMILRHPIVQDLAQALSKGSKLTQAISLQDAKQRIRACTHQFGSLACRLLSCIPSDIEYIAPCSPLQQGIISKSLTSEERGAYFNSFELRLAPDVQADTLRSAWYDLIASEPILRSTFLATYSGHIQVALSKHQDLWQSLHLGDPREALAILKDRRESWIDENATHITRPLQLLYVSTPQSCSLHINIFHAIYDGNSFDLMLHRVASQLRGQHLLSGPSFLEALVHGPLSTVDSWSFWKEQLRDWKSSSITASSTSSSANVPVVARRPLPLEIIEGIRKAQNVTMQAVVLALWTSVLQQRHSSGLTIGTIMSGRSIDLSGVDKTIGPLFNTLPFFNKRIADRTWSSLIRQCHEFGTSALPFQHTSLQRIQKWFSNGRPLFDTLFTFQAETQGDATNGLWNLGESNPEPDHPLAVEFKKSEDGKIWVTLVAQGHLLDQDSLDAMLSMTESHLHLMATKTDDKIPVAVQTKVEPLPSSGASSAFVDDGEADFMWDDVATAIREEVAALVGIDPIDVGAATAMLTFGLDSIDMIKLSTKLRARKIDISASQIMRLQTIVELTSLVGNSEVNGSAVDSTAERNFVTVQSKLHHHLVQRGVDLSNVEEVLPTTALQDSMLAAMLESNFEWYFNHDVLELEQGIDLERMKTAWRDVTKAHPILRTTFAEVEDADLPMGFCQLVAAAHDPWQGDVVAQDLGESEGMTKRATRRAMKGTAKNELFQISSLTVGPKVYLVLSIAHALYDGWSLGLIYRDLEKVYHGNVLESVSSNPLLSALSTATNDESEGFWSEYLNGATSTLIPRSETTEPVPTVHRADRVSSLSLDAIQKFCKTNSISLQALCQGCWAVVVATWTKQLDVTFGAVMSGRDVSGTEDLVFPTMNTIATRYMPFGTSSEFLQYVEENLSGARQHQAYPLRKALVAAGSPPGGLFNSLFLLQKSVSGGASQTLLKSVSGKSAVDYPVCVEAEVADASLVWRTACQSQFASGREASALVAQIDAVLQFLVGSPESQILAFSDNRASICGQGAFTLGWDEGEAEVVAQPQDQVDSWGETSTAIKSVLSQVSQIPDADIRLSNTIYHLGLDSISALKVSSLLRRQGLNLAPRQLLSASSIAEMAVMVQSETMVHNVDQEDPWQPPPSIDVDRLLAQYDLSANDVETVLPALPMQVYMLGTWQNSGGEVFYPEFTYLLDHTCDAREIHTAWDTIVKTTPILRTRVFSTANAKLPALQVILKSNSPESLRRMAYLRATWDDAKSLWILKLKIHHALYDGFSLPIIMDKLARAIKMKVQSQEQVPLSRWIDHTTFLVSEEAEASRKSFWTSYLVGCLPSAEPQSSPSSQTPRVSRVERSALTNLTSLRNKAVQHGISVQSLFLAAYARVLYRHEGSPTPAASTAPSFVVFGIYLANRGGDNYDEEALATFPCLNLVPLKVDVSEVRLDVMAAQIQRDLGEINSRGRADVGLWEIDAWTGIRLSSFVNFLSLPEMDSAEDAHKPNMRAVDGLAQASETSSDTTRMGDIVVRDSFPPALDVEASLKGDSLDIGVFGARSVLVDEPAAADLIAEIAGVLQNEI